MLLRRGPRCTNGKDTEATSWALSTGALGVITPDRKPPKNAGCCVRITLRTSRRTRIKCSRVQNFPQKAAYSQLSNSFAELIAGKLCTTPYIHLEIPDRAFIASRLKCLAPPPPLPVIQSQARDLLFSSR